MFLERCAADGANRARGVEGRGQLDLLYEGCEVLSWSKQFGRVGCARLSFGVCCLSGQLAL